MSIRSDKLKTADDTMAALTNSVSTDASLGEGASYCVASPENPLQRNVVVSIRASLNDLCLQKSKGTWAPSTDALKAMFQQRKFTSLAGDADVQGDLKVCTFVPTTFTPFCRTLSASRVSPHLQKSVLTSWSVSPGVEALRMICRPQTTTCEFFLLLRWIEFCFNC